MQKSDCTISTSNLHTASSKSLLDFYLKIKTLPVDYRVDALRRWEASVTEHLEVKSSVVKLVL